MERKKIRRELGGRREKFPDQNLRRRMKQGKEFFLNSEQLANFIDSEKKKKIVLPSSFKPSAVDRNMRIKFLWKCINKLDDRTEKHLKVFMHLRVVSGWSYKQLSEYFKVSIQAVKIMESEAKNKIKDRMERSRLIEI